MTCVKGNVFVSNKLWLLAYCLPSYKIDVIMQTANTQKEQTKHGKDHGKYHVQMHPEVYQTDNQMQGP